MPTRQRDVATSALGAAAQSTRLASLINFLPTPVAHQIGAGRRTLDTVHRRLSRTKPPAYGAREVARVTRQIAEGRITAANGLVRCV